MTPQHDGEADETPNDDSAPADETPNDAEGTPEKEQPVSLKRFLSDTMIYGIVDTSDKAIGFVLLPITTYCLSPVDYGLLNIFANTSGMLFLLFSAGMLNGFFRFYTATNDPHKQRDILSTAYWTVVISTLCWSGLMFLFASQLDRWLFQGDGRGYIWTLAAVTFLQFAESFGSARLQADGRPWMFVFVSLVRTALTRGIGLVLILMDYGAWGWIIGELLGLIVTYFVMMNNGLAGIRLVYDKQAARDMFPYSASLVPAAISHWVMTSCDAYLLKFLGSLTAVGMYGVGQRISSIMQLINQAFILGWRRFAFKNMHHEEGPQLLARGVTLFAIAGGYGALGLSMLGDDLTYWVINPKFHEGMAVIVPLTWATFIGGVSDIASIGLHKAKRTLLLSWLNILAALMNIEFNLVLIPEYGIAGAAVATLISQLIKTTLVWHASQKAFPLPFEYRRLSIAAATFLGILFLGQFAGQWAISHWPGHTGWIVAGVGQSIWLAFGPLLLWVFGFFEPHELRLMKELAVGWRRWIPLRSGVPGP